MKKILELCLIMFVLLDVCVSVSAYCTTGYACSIQDIEKIQAEKNREFLADIDNYFSKKINEDIFFGKISPSVFYNDLFIFNTIV